MNQLVNKANSAANEMQNKKWPHTSNTIGIVVEVKQHTNLTELSPSDITTQYMKIIYTKKQNISEHALKWEPILRRQY